MGNIKTSIDNQIVVNTASEDTSLEEILLYVSQNINSWVDKNTIWDLSHFNFQDVSTDSIRLFISKSQNMSEKRKGLKTAVVAQSDLGYGMMRMLSIMAEGKFQFQLETFRSLSEAITWLE